MRAETDNELGPRNCVTLIRTEEPKRTVAVAIATLLDAYADDVLRGAKRSCPDFQGALRNETAGLACSPAIRRS